MISLVVLTESKKKLGSFPMTHSDSVFNAIKRKEPKKKKPTTRQVESIKRFTSKDQPLSSKARKLSSISKGADCCESGDNDGRC